jgi:hypothetical protein
MKKYTVTHGSILHDGQLYQAGDTISLSDSLANQLAIHLGKPEQPSQMEEPSDG